MRKIVVGDPMKAETNMGPLISEDQYNKVRGYVEGGLRAGAKMWNREPGDESDLPGHFVQPTVFTKVGTDMKIAQEEIFGPVLSVIEFESVKEAIEIANGTMYGLAAGIWTPTSTRPFILGAISGPVRLK